MYVCMYVCIYIYIYIHINNYIITENTVCLFFVCLWVFPPTCLRASGVGLDSIDYEVSG